MKDFVFFDFDGTIADCRQFQVDRLKKLFLKYGVDTKNIDFLELIGPPLYNTFAKFMGKQKAQQVLQDYNSTFSFEDPQGFCAFEGVPQMLIQLKSLGFKIALTSLQHQNIVHTELKFLGLQNVFDAIFCDTPQKAYRSKSELIADALKQTKLDPNRVVVVGDTIFDVQGGTQNRLCTIGVSWGYGKIDQQSVNFVASTPQQLLKILESLHAC